MFPVCRHAIRKQAIDNEPTVEDLVYLGSISVVRVPKTET